MGSLVYEKKIGKNARIRIYRFRDGYRLFALRRTKKGYWVESSATSYYQTFAEAKKDASQYRTLRDIEMLHPVLRNYGYDYSGTPLKGLYR